MKRMIYFVTGTDTGAGKTHVTALIVRALRAAGREARAIKPIETGWPLAPGTDPVSGTDAAVLAKASGRTIGETVMLRFALPRSPKAAAQAEGIEIDPKALVDWCRSRAGEPLLVEGAGGWMVPIEGRMRMRELAAGIGAEVVVVAKAGLGTINHAILTAESVQMTSRLVGVILSRRPEDEIAFARENAAEIAAQTGARVAIVPDDLEQIVGWFAATR